jgi:hypothetical protein
MANIEDVDCIQANKYDESKCKKVIDNLYACCDRYYRENGYDPKPTACPKPDLLKVKIEQRKQDPNVDARLVKVKGSDST